MFRFTSSIITIALTILVLVAKTSMASIEGPRTARKSKKKEKKKDWCFGLEFQWHQGSPAYMCRCRNLDCETRSDLQIISTTVSAYVPVHVDLESRSTVVLSLKNGKKTH